jgi:hypothetical protein
MSDDAGSAATGGDQGTSAATGEGDQTQGQQANQQGTDDQPLGAAGEKALQEWKERAKTAEQKAKSAGEVAKERDALAAKLAEFEEATKSEQEKALDKARKEAHTQGSGESDAKWAARVVKADVRALATEKFADPSDAIAFLDTSQFKVDDDGNTDTKAINSALDGLLKEKPHLAKQQKSSTGSADQGARGTGTTSQDMNALLRQKIAGR